jgi:hypothetical protein
MYCPNCATSVTKQQKFCRACGFALAKVVQLLEESDAVPEEFSQELAEQRQRIERWRDLAFYVFCSGAGLGLLTLIGYGIIYRLMLIKGQLWQGAGALLVILTVLVGLVLVVLQARAEELQAKAKSGQLKPPPRLADNPALETLPPAVTTANLLTEGRAEVDGSITEDTTRTLQPHS